MACAQEDHAAVCLESNNNSITNTNNNTNSMMYIDGAVLQDQSRYSQEPGGDSSDSNGGGHGGRKRKKPPPPQPNNNKNKKNNNAKGGKKSRLSNTGHHQDYDYMPPPPPSLPQTAAAAAANTIPKSPQITVPHETRRPRGTRRPRESYTPLIPQPSEPYMRPHSAQRGGVRGISHHGGRGSVGKQPRMMPIHILQKSAPSVHNPGELPSYTTQQQATTSMEHGMGGSVGLAGTVLRGLPSHHHHQQQQQQQQQQQANNININNNNNNISSGIAHSQLHPVPSLVKGNTQFSSATKNNNGSGSTRQVQSQEEILQRLQQTLMLKMSPQQQEMLKVMDPEKRKDWLKQVYTVYYHRSAMAKQQEQLRNRNSTNSGGGGAAPPLNIPTSNGTMLVPGVVTLGNMPPQTFNSLLASTANGGGGGGGANAPSMLTTTMMGNMGNMLPVMIGNGTGTGTGSHNNMMSWAPYNVRGLAGRSQVPQQQQQIPGVLNFPYANGTTNMMLGVPVGGMKQSSSSGEFIPIDELQPAIGPGNGGGGGRGRGRGRGQSNRGSTVKKGR